ncbi:MAG: zinc-binding dehydrogenase, partial [Thaumarchaeota archaeon]
VWEAIGRMSPNEASKPDAKPGWVVLDVEAAGICGSEISAFLGKNELRKPPLVMGHEFSGVVVEVGDGVSPDWRGKRVVVNPLVTCGICRFCRSGDRQLCLERKIVGIDYPGGFAERTAVPVASCTPVTDLLRAALIEPLACGVRAVGRSEARLGDRALVFGAGMIGLSIIKLLRGRGVSQCIAVDTVPSRLKWAKLWGATDTLGASAEDTAEAVKRLAPGGLDCVVDAVGHAQTRAQSLAMARRGGRVVFVGLHSDETSLHGNAVVRSETEIVGSFAYSDDDFRRAVGLAEGGLIDMSGGWLDVRPLSAGQEAFVEQAAGPAPFSKILLKP